MDKRKKPIKELEPTENQQEYQYEYPDFFEK